MRGPHGEQLLQDENGNWLTLEQARYALENTRPKRRNGRDPEPFGYAGRPGAGPDGETCKSCQHLVRNRLSKVYLKCGLMKAFWRGSRRTDVLARSPACQYWGPKT